MQAEPRVGATLRPELPFRYIGGDPALDLVNTVDWTRHGPDDERLTSYDRLTEFAEGAGVLDSATADKLRRIAARRPGEAQRVLASAHALRDALQHLVSASAGESPAKHAPDKSALETVNSLMGDALHHLNLARNESGNALRWQRMAESLEAPLWPLVWSAAQLLSGDEQNKLRVCGGPDCGWVYVDRSRNRLRRWCQMETCGNRAKAKRRYSRERSGA